MSQNQLAIKNNLSSVVQSINQECNSYKKHSQIVKHNEEKLTKYIQDNTKKEVDDINEAIRKLNLKVEKLMEVPQAKQVKNQLDSSSKEMFLSLQKVMECFNKGKKCIMDREDIPDVKKQQCIRLMYSKLIEKLYTEDEILQFKQFFSRVSPDTHKMLI